MVGYSDIRYTQFSRDSSVIGQVYFAKVVFQPGFSPVLYLRFSNNRGIGLLWRLSWNPGYIQKFLKIKNQNLLVSESWKICCFLKVASFNNISSFLNPNLVITDKFHCFFSVRKYGMKMTEKRLRTMR